MVVVVHCRCRHHHHFKRLLMLKLDLSLGTSSLVHWTEAIFPFSCFTVTFSDFSLIKHDSYCIVLACVVVLSFYVCYCLHWVCFPLALPVCLNCVSIPQWTKEEGQRQAAVANQFIPMNTNPKDVLEMRNKVDPPPHIQQYKNILISFVFMFILTRRQIFILSKL